MGKDGGEEEDADPSHRSVVELVKEWSVVVTFLKGIPWYNSYNMAHTRYCHLLS